MNKTEKASTGNEADRLEKRLTLPPRSVVAQGRRAVKSDAGILPPIEAYDAFAASYKSYAEGRRQYQQAIDRIVISRIRDAKSLLDAGAGDGSRALEIGRSAHVGRIVLLEPSSGMRAH